MREKSSSEFFRGFCPGIIWWTHARTYFTAIGCYWLLLVSTPIKGCNPPKKILGETTSSTNSYQRLNGRKSGKDACHQRFLLPSCGRFASRAAHMVSAWRSGGKCQLTCSRVWKKPVQIMAKKLEVTRWNPWVERKKCHFNCILQILFLDGWYFNPFQLCHIFSGVFCRSDIPQFSGQELLWNGAIYHDPPQKIRIPCLACKKDCQSILYQSSSHEHPFIRLFRWSHWFEAVKAEVCI